MDAVGRRLYEAKYGRAKLAPVDQVSELLQEASSAAGNQSFSARFLASEWDQVVDSWQLTTWEAYRDVPRLGRRVRLTEAHRRALWGIFEQVRSGLQQKGLITRAAMFNTLAALYTSGAASPFDFVVVDESQDISIAQLRFLGAIGGNRPNGLFFAGDLGQRIFQQPFSWKAVGVDVRGRSTVLKICYRTTHQIRSQADRLLCIPAAQVAVDRFDFSVPAPVRPPASWISRLAQRSLTLRPARLQSRLHDPLPPEASAAFLPPPLLRLLPGGTNSSRVGFAPTVD